MEHEYDIVIVGAGPAGSTAAYYLGRTTDYRILVLDRHAFPRYKACGGGLTYIDQWQGEFEHFDAVRESLPLLPITSVRQYWRGTMFWELRGRTWFAQVPRVLLDHALLSQALLLKNVAFHQERVVGLERMDGGTTHPWQVKTVGHRVRARAVIGADGVFSTVRRILTGRRLPSAAYARCVGCEVRSAPAGREAHIFHRWSGVTGYGWCFPSANGYTFGLGTAGHPRLPLRAALNALHAELRRREILPETHTIARTYGAGVPLQLTRWRAADGVVLCGDAMGAVRQTSGEGIYYAMQTGKAAARTLREEMPPTRRHYAATLQPVLRDLRFWPLTVPVWVVRAVTFLLLLGLRLRIRAGRPARWQWALLRYLSGESPRCRTGHRHD